MGRLLKSEEMGGLRCLLLVLLSCLEAVGGEGSGSECSQPTLPNGYLVPEKQSYSHHENISYSCEKDYKPAVEGWWAIINCENGTWSPKPECIDLNACTAPDVPDNAKLRQNPTNWYPNGNSARFDCVKEYELDGHTTIKCENGEWTSTVMCKKRSDTCGEPPFVNHAVITQRYQDVFAVNEKVQYKCEDFFTLEGSDECFCQSGGWSTPPTCKLPTPAPSEENRPVMECGTHPDLDNGDIDFQDDWSLTYKCRSHHKLQGPKKVVCNSKGEWTSIPTCLDPCTISKGLRPRDDIKAFPKTKYLPRGESDWFKCDKLGWWYTCGTCIHGEMAYRACQWVTTFSQACGA